MRWDRRLMTTRHMKNQASDMAGIRKIWLTENIAKSILIIESGISHMNY